MYSKNGFEECVNRDQRGRERETRNEKILMKKSLQTLKKKKRRIRQKNSLSLSLKRRAPRRALHFHRLRQEQQQLLQRRSRPFWRACPGARRRAWPCRWRRARRRRAPARSARCVRRPRPRCPAGGRCSLNNYFFFLIDFDEEWVRCEILKGKIRRTSKSKETRFSENRFFFTAHSPFAVTPALAPRRR